jgi:predicted phosphodiesterase
LGESIGSPMRIAVIADIHGNMEAFEQVLADIDHCGVDDVICLGDCIGYGPEPERVLQTVAARGIPCVLGNHELAIVDSRCLNWFNPLARESLIKTQAMLSPRSMAFIAALKRFEVRHSHRFVHGFPPDLPKMYLFQASRAKLLSTFDEMTEPLCFVGHTHQLELIGFDGRQLTQSPLAEGRIILSSEARYIINIGSVGQPRDGDNRAKYAIWDDASHDLEIRCIPYDIARTADKIIRAGLPVAHAKRLW